MAELKSQRLMSSYLFDMTKVILPAKLVIHTKPSSQ